jgi:hypothetical protein
MSTAPDNKVRFQLRPTVVGEAIMDRLNAQGADRAAEARRWIELGFAAEQAGFRLDGVELRHADRAWHVQPNLLSNAPTQPLDILGPAPKTVPRATISASTEVVPQSIQVAVVPDPQIQPTATSSDHQSLTNRLRGLSA